MNNGERVNVKANFGERVEVLPTLPPTASVVGDALPIYFGGGEMGRQNVSMRDVAIWATRLIDQELEDLQRVIDEAARLNRDFVESRKSEFEELIRRAM